MWSVEWVIKSIVDNHRVFERQHKNEPHALTLNAEQQSRSIPNLEWKKTAKSMKANIEILRV